jgi:hypothetical protein
VSLEKAGAGPGSHAPVRKNVIRGLWRASVRTAKRPILAVLLLQLRGSDLQELCDENRLRRLRWAWSNPNSGALEYLLAVASAAASGSGPILECGSGLTTIVVGAVVRHTGRPFVSLENSPWWARHVRWSMKLAQAEVDYRVQPLRDYGEFDWYEADPPLHDVSMIICDGPPAATRGGRYGLLPVYGQHLSADAEIYLDDFDRAAENIVTQRWSDEFGWSVEHSYASGKGTFCRMRKSAPPVTPR